MSRASEAWDTLSAAMAHTIPACHDDDRFIEDTTEPADVEDLCNLCPIFAECRAYARAARPPAGIWAGERHTRRGEGDSE